MASSAPSPNKRKRRPMLTFDGLGLESTGVDPFPSLATAKPRAQPMAVVSPTLEAELELVELSSKRQKTPADSVMSIHEEEEQEQEQEDAAVGALATRMAAALK